MHIGYRRPLFCMCICLMAGAVLSFTAVRAGVTDIWMFVWPIGTAVSVTVGSWLLCRTYRPARMRTVLWAGGLCIGLTAAILVSGSVLTARVRPDSFGSVSAEADEPVWLVTGEIREVQVGGNQITVYGCKLDSINGTKVSCFAVLSCAFTGHMSPGDAFEATLPVTSLEAAAGDMTPSLIGDGYTVGLWAENETDITVKSHSTSGWRTKTDALRRRMSAVLQLSVGTDGQGLPSALLLGERRYVPSEVRRDCRRSGMSHMLAISGLHMTLLFGLLGGLLRWLTVPKRLRALLLSVAAFGYLWLLRFPPSATRAVIMLATLYLSWAWGARSDPLTALGVAGAVILLCQPWAAADTGFWMSFSATLGLLTVMPVVSGLLSPKRLDKHAGRGQHVRWRIRRRLTQIVSAVFTGVVAMSCSLWITAPVYGAVSLWSPLATVLLMPLFAGMILLSLLALPFGGSWAGQTVLIPLIRLLGRGMARCVSQLSDSPYALLSLRGGVYGVLIAVMTVGLLILLFANLPRRRQWTVLLPLLCGWVLLAGVAGVSAGLHADEVTVTACKTSTRSETVLLTRGQEAVVIDMSDGSLTAMQTAVRQAQAQGATELSALVLTHVHSRTPGTLYRILRAEKVRTLYLPEPQTEQEYYLTVAVLSRASETGVSCMLYRAGDAGGAGDRLSPTDGLQVSLYRANLPRSAQPVLMLWLETAHDSLLWCGGAVAESDLSDTADALMKQADTVLFCAHGPLYKQAYALPTDCAPALVCFGDETCAAWFDAASLPDPCPVLIVGGYRGVMSLS